jgi:hypothetical protein
VSEPRCCASCPTILSRYNLSDYCFLHLPVEMPKHIAAGCREIAGSSLPRRKLGRPAVPANSPVWRLAHGKCWRCGQPQASGRKLCSAHSEYARVKNLAAYYERKQRMSLLVERVSRMEAVA